MAAIDVILPQWGMGMTEGTVIEWAKAVGDQVTEGDDLVEIDTAKATSFLQSPATGVLTKILVDEDETVPVGEVLATIEPSA